MKVTVICENCSEGDDTVEMNHVGHLIFNPQTKSQTQTYKCNNCGFSVTVTLEVEMPQ